ncbi:hypothetical protein GCM10010431_55440 [Streptomyces kunmingensis]
MGVNPGSYKRAGVEYPASRADSAGSYGWDAKARLVWLIAGLTRRPATVPYRQAVPDGPYEALATRHPPGRRPGHRRHPAHRQAGARPRVVRPEVPASREQPGSPLRHP